MLRIEPSNAVAIRNLGLAHYQAGELNDAFPFLHKAAELEPKNEDVRLKLAPGHADTAAGGLREWARPRRRPTTRPQRA